MLPSKLVAPAEPLMSRREFGAPFSITESIVRLSDAGASDGAASLSQREKRVSGAIRSITRASPVNVAGGELALDPAERLGQDVVDLAARDLAARRRRCRRPRCR